MRMAAVQLLALFIAALVTAGRAQEAAAAAEAEGVEVIRVALGSPLEVTCALGPGETPHWAVDGAALGDGEGARGLRRGERAEGQGLVAVLTADRAAPHHAGLYSCGGREPHGRAQRVEIIARSARTHTHGEGAAAGEAAGTGEFDGAEIRWYDVRGNLSMHCGEVGEPVLWKKNGTLVKEIPELGERVELTEGGRSLRVVPRAREEDWGNWSCSGPQGAKYWRVQGKPHARLPSDSAVVEGQRLKLVCRLTGKPYPPVQWRYTNETLGNISLPVEAAFGERVTLRVSDQGVEGAELVVEPAARSDAGTLQCVPLPSVPAVGTPASSTLRVKDMYAALWPFLGIVAEVVILCAVILVYERRRAPQLDDSDTDNHDQKKS